MTITECVNKKTALDLNPFQIFIFLNGKTKQYENRLRDYFDKKWNGQLFHLIFIDDNPRSHIQARLPETMDAQLYTIIMNSDVVARVMPKWAGDYRYLTEVLPTDGSKTEQRVDEFLRKLRSEYYISLTNTIRRYFQYGNAAFTDFLNDVYQGDLQQVVNMSLYYTRMHRTADVRRAEQFAFRLFYNLNEEQRTTINQLMKETLGYASEEDSFLIFDDFVHFQNEETADDHHIKKPTFKIIISPQDKKPIDTQGKYAITIVTENNEQHALTFPHKGAKMIYLLTLLCQTKVGGLPTNYFKIDESMKIISNIYNKLYYYGGTDWVKKLNEKVHNITMYRTHASESIKKDMWMNKSMAYWVDFENTKVTVRNRQVELRSIRLPKENIIIQDNPQDLEPLTELVDMMPPLNTLFGIRNMKTIQFLDEINQNLAMATKNPVMDYDEIDMPEHEIPYYME